MNIVILYVMAPPGLPAEGRLTPFIVSKGEGTQVVFADGDLEIILGVGCASVEGDIVFTAEYNEDGSLRRILYYELPSTAGGAPLVIQPSRAGHTGVIPAKGTRLPPPTRLTIL